MTRLLPYQYKKIGLVMISIGICLWTIMQLGLLTNTLGSYLTTDGLRITNTSFAIIGFFGFLIGLYFVAFSKEKREDEMIHKIRTESFQFAAFINFFFLLTGFIIFALCGEPESEGVMLFFACSLLFFWASYIFRFMYQLKKLENNEE